MTKPRVFVTLPMAQEAIDLLDTKFDVLVWSNDDPPSKEILIERARECFGFLTTVEDKIDEPILMAGANQLRVIANCAVGFDNFDLEIGTKLGIAMCNTPGVLTKTTADLAFALILATARMVVQGDRDVREGKWRSWHPLAYAGPDVHGATIGIIGLGQIGLEVAKRALGFEMTVLYHNRMRRYDAEEVYELQFCEDISDLFKQSDFVSIHVPLKKETYHMIGRTALELMKPTAILVNTARGSIVDPEALYDALRNGVIAGVGLDVTEPEPIPPEHPLLALPNVIITPHIGSASTRTRREMAVLAAQNILALAEGKAMPSCLNPQVLDQKG